MFLSSLFIVAFRAFFPSKSMFAVLVQIRTYNGPADGAAFHMFVQVNMLFAGMLSGLYQLKKHWFC
jgi:hypothetical protein